MTTLEEWVQFSHFVVFSVVIFIGGDRVVYSLQLTVNSWLRLWLVEIFWESYLQLLPLVFLVILGSNTLNTINSRIKALKYLRDYSMLLDYGVLKFSNFGSNFISIFSPILAFILAMLSKGISLGASKRVEIGERLDQGDVTGFINGRFGTLYMGFRGYFAEMFFITLWTLLLFFPGVYKTYAYAAWFYCMYLNRDISPGRALKESEAFMEGHKFNLFLATIGYTILFGIIVNVINSFFRSDTFGKIEYLYMYDNNSLMEMSEGISNNFNDFGQITINKVISIMFTGKTVAYIVINSLLKTMETIIVSIVVGVFFKLNVFKDFILFGREKIID